MNNDAGPPGECRYRACRAFRGNDDVRTPGLSGIQYVTNVEGDGAEMFAAVCKLGLEGIVSKKLTAPYRSGNSKSWIKTRNPKAPASTRVHDGTF